MYQVVPGPVIVWVAATTAIDVTADLCCAGLPLSVTVTVKVDIPDELGVPEITPVVAARVNPDGRVPEVIDQV
jgi:hypothetical protein